MRVFLRLGDRYGKIFFSIMMNECLQIILITLQKFLFSLILAQKIGLRWRHQNKLPRADLKGE